MVSREELRAAVWTTGTFVDFERGLNFCIAQIRGVLKDDAISPSFIRTVPKRGYQFIAPVEQVSSSPTVDCLRNFGGVSDLFATQPPKLAREMATVSHFDLERVKTLVRTRPSLVRARWDWGFGDWETPLGAASHMGNRPIAEFLITN